MSPTDVSEELAVFIFRVKEALLNLGLRTSWILKMDAASCSEK
jgi:hypothetical protein